MFLSSQATEENCNSDIWPLDRIYVQWYGVDYDETFSHVARMDTIRAILSIAAQN